MAKEWDVKTYWNGPMVTKAVREAAVSPLAKAGFLVETEGKRSLRTGGATAGARQARSDTSVYWNSDLKRWVKASAVGQPPHTQSGNLRGSIQTAGPARGGWLGLSVVYVVGPTLQGFYGAVHEFSRRFPRAFMFPALLRMRGRFKSLFKRLPLAGTPSGRKANAARGHVT